jgi:hypothetical protein
MSLNDQPPRARPGGTARRIKAVSPQLSTGRHCTPTIMAGAEPQFDLGFMGKARGESDWMRMGLGFSSALAAATIDRWARTDGAVAETFRQQLSSAWRRQG